MCTRPDCPENARDERWDRARFVPPGCVCGKPLMLYVPPGEHAHPCPVHPEYTIRGADYYSLTRSGHYGGPED